MSLPNSKSTIFELRQALSAAKNVLNQIWTFDAGGPVLGLFCDDINQDGNSEIIVPSRSGEVFALTKEGQVIWNYKAKDWARSVFVADVDSDQCREVIVGSEDKSVHILDSFGNIKYIHPVNDWARSVGVVDLNSDGLLEILVGCEDGKVYSISHDGKPIWDFNAGSRVYSIHVFKPIKGTPLIVVGSQSGNIHVVDINGSGKKVFCANAAVRCIYVADINNDNEPEILFGSEDWNVYCIKSNGELLWKYKTLDIVRSITADDIDIDGQWEVISGGMDDYIYFFQSDGTLKWKYKANYRVRTILTGNLRNGPQKELIIGSEDGSIYVYSVSFTPMLLDSLKDAYKSVYATDKLENLSFSEKQLLEELGILTINPREKFLKVDDIRRDLAQAPYFKDVQKILEISAKQLSFNWEHSANGRVTSLDHFDISWGNVNERIGLIGSEDHHIFAINKMGEMDWVYEGNNQVLCMEVIEYQGVKKIIVGTSDNQIQLLSIKGELIKTVSTQDRVWSIHQVKKGSPQIIIGSYDRKIHLIDLDTGSELWSYQTGHWVKTVWSADIDGDGIIEIIAGSYDNRIYVLDEVGKLKWTCELPDWPNSIVTHDLNADGKAEIIVASENSRVYVIDSNSKYQWSYVSGARMLWVATCDFDEDGIAEIFACSADGFLYKLNAQGYLIDRYYFASEVRCVHLVNSNNGNALFVGLGSGITFSFEILDKRYVKEEFNEYVLDAINAFEDYESISVNNYLLQIEAAIRGHCDFAVLQNLFNLAMQSGYEEIQKAWLSITSRFITSSDHLQELQNSIEKYWNVFTGEIKIASLFAIEKSMRKGTKSLHERIIDFFLLQNEDSLIQREIGLFTSRNCTAGKEYDVINSIVNWIETHPLSWVTDEYLRALSILANRFPGVSFHILEKLSLLAVKRNYHFKRYFQDGCDGVAKIICDNYINLTTNSDVENSLYNLLNLSEIATDKDSMRGELKNTLLLLTSLMSYAKIEDMAKITTDVNMFKNKMGVEVIGFPLWLQENEIQKDISRIYTDYFECFEKGLTEEQKISLDSLLGVISRIKKSAEKCGHFLAQTLLLQALDRWESIVYNKQQELINSARIDMNSITMPVCQIGKEVHFVISLTNIGLGLASNISICLLSNDITYISKNENKMVPDISPGSSSEILCELTPLVSRIPRILLSIDYLDNLGGHKIVDVYEVQLEDVISWTSKIPENIYDEKGAITDIEDATPFVGRTELIESLVSSTARSTIIFGQKRSGKTSVLYRCLEPALLKKNIPYFFSFQDLRSLTTAELLYQVLFDHRSLGRDLTSRGRGILGLVNSFEKTRIKRIPWKEFSNNPINYFFRTIRELNFSLKKHKLMILGDELDDFVDLLSHENLLSEVLSPLRAIFEHYKNIFFVFSASINWVRSIGANQVIHNTFNFVDRKKIGFLSNDEALELLTEPLRGKISYNPTALKRSIRATGGNPYILQKFCKKAIHILNEKQSPYVDLEILNKVLSDMEHDLDPCLTNYWSLLQESVDEFNVFRSLLPAHRAWRSLDSDWLMVNDISKKNGDKRKDELQLVINSLTDKEYLEINNRTDQELYRIKIGLFPDWIYSTHQV